MLKRLGSLGRSSSKDDSNGKMEWVMHPFEYLAKTQGSIPLSASLGNKWGELNVCRSHFVGNGSRAKTLSVRKDGEVAVVWGETHNGYKYTICISKARDYYMSTKADYKFPIYNCSIVFNLPERRQTFGPTINVDIFP